jgi:Phage stabilisation protein
LGTGSGSTGTYTINNSQTVASETMYALNWTVLPSTDGAFTGGETCDIVDNYFVYNRPASQQWGASGVLSPISGSTSFSSKDGSPDNLVALIVDHREVYLMGEASSEVWTDVGAVPFPFQRIPGTSTQHGVAARFSLARLGDSFAYVSRNNRGQAQIMQMKGYVPSRISNHAVENSITNQYVDDAIAWTYQLEGHEVYVVSFPTLNLTWAYDIASGMWHKWLYTDNTGTYSRHRGNCCAVFQGMVLVGDYANGSIYELDKQNYTDNGQNIRRLRRAPHLVTDLQRQYFDELQIQFQPGVGTTGVSVSTDTNIYLGSPYVISASATLTIAPTLTYVIGIANPITSLTDTNYPQAMLRWSNDGGSTWSREYWVTIGQEGKYKNRAIWRRLGMARDRVFEVSITDPVNAVIVSANLKATQGEN